MRDRWDALPSNPASTQLKHPAVSVLVAVVFSPTLGLKPLLPSLSLLLSPSPHTHYPPRGLETLPPSSLPRSLAASLPSNPLTHFKAHFSDAAVTDPPTGKEPLCALGPLGRPGQATYAACALSPKAPRWGRSKERVLKRRWLAMRVDYEMEDIETLLSLSRFDSPPLSPSLLLSLLFSPLLFRDRLLPLTD